MKKTLQSKSSAFTLIELLVVIAIIGFLASVVLLSLNTARAKARDARRAEEVRSIVNALTLYYDQNSKLPCHTFEDSQSANFLKPLVTSKFTASKFRDPSNTSVYNYQYLSFKANAGGPCGQYASLGVVFEKKVTSCPAGGYLVDASGASNHCHIYFPSTLPPPCSTDAYKENEFLCLTLVDTTDEY